LLLAVAVAVQTEAVQDMVAVAVLADMLVELLHLQLLEIL
jgi:hypothetical protein